MKEEIEKIKAAIEYMATHYVTYGGGNLYRQVMEILNPPSPTEFLECDTCREKPGSPTLCKGCIHNRALISRLK